MRRIRPALPSIPSTLLALVCLFLANPSEGLGQASRADSAAVLLTAAQDFQAEGRWEVAEALYHYISERYGDTWAGAQAVEALQEAPTDRSSQSAQTELMVWATTYGAWLGVAIPGALGADSPGPFGAGLLLGGPAGFLGGRALGRSRPLSEGQVRAITFGSLWGTWMGYGVMEILDLGEGDACPDISGSCYESDPEGKDVFKALVVGGLAGTVGGALLSRKPIPSGVATTANFGALWGTWFGVAGGVLLDLEGDKLLTSTLIGGNGGLLTAAMLAPGWDISRNRARLVSIAGVIGGLAGAGLDLMIQPDDEKVVLGIPLAGSIVGLATGVALTSGIDRRGAVGRGAAEEMGILGTGGALLHYGDGRLKLRFPTPFPTVVAADRDTGFSFEPALGLTLLQSRFW